MSDGQSARHRWFRNRFTLALIALAALGGALVLARQATYGVSVSFDSINYLAVAERLLEGRGFRNYDWSPYAQQPPLYPLLLAAASLGVFEPIQVAGMLNAALFAATILVAGCYLRRRVGSGWLACWGAGAIALSLPLGDLGSWALSETAFILFATLALIRTDDFLEEGRNASLIGAAVFCALAWQTRYIGVVVTAVVAAALWFGSDSGLRDRVRRSGLVAAASAVPMGWWTVRNHFAVGGLTGDRAFRGTSWTARFGEAYEGMAGWFAFEISGAAVLISVLLALAVSVVVAFTPAAGSTDGRGYRPPPVGLRSPAIFLGFGLVFLVLLVAAAFFTVVAYGVESRYLAPLYVPFVLVVVFAADRVFRFAAERSHGVAGVCDEATRRRRHPPGGGAAAPTGLRFVRATLAAGLFFVLLAQVATTLSAVRDANGASPRVWRGFTAPPWDDSPIFRYIDGTGIPSEVFSNFPILLYLRYRDQASFRFLPGSEAEEWVANTEPGAYVVWFRRASPNFGAPYGFVNIGGQAGLEPVARFADGAIFRVNPGYAPSNQYHAVADTVASGAAGSPAARSDFDLFLDGTTLVYFREPCAPADIESPFFLHVYGGVPALRTLSRERSGPENRDFFFTEFGERFLGKCVAIVELPGGLSRIRTGQFESGRGELWSAEFSVALEYARKRIENSETFRYYRARTPADVSVADLPELHADEQWWDYRSRALGTGALLLQLGSGSAGDADEDGPVPSPGVSVVPVARFAGGTVFRVDPDRATKPSRSVADFVTSGAAGEAVTRGEPAPGEQEWDEWMAGAEPGGLVVWFRNGEPGPSGARRYGIVEALVERAGLEPVAWLSDGAVFRVNPAYVPDPDRSTYDYLTSGAAGGALANSEFDLYLDGTTVYYLRDPCAPDEVNDRFFLHAYAGDPTDLPASRVRYRFENLDFWFSDVGRFVDGKCLASARLPDYGIVRARTGQYRSGEGEIWSAEFRPGDESFADLR